MYSEKCNGELSKDPVEKLLFAMAKAHQEPGDHLCCSHCLKPVTTTNEKTTLGTKHLFNVSNPDGLHFNIACFKEAWGCGMHGNPCTEHSWFAAYRWQFARCLSCDAHLGWYYELPNQSTSVDHKPQSSAEHFFGLIIERLVPAEQPDTD